MISAFLENSFKSIKLHPQNFPEFNEKKGIIKSIIPVEARKVDCCFPNKSLTSEVHHQVSSRIRLNTRSDFIPELPQLFHLFSLFLFQVWESKNNHKSIFSDQIKSPSVFSAAIKSAIRQRQNLRLENIDQIRAICYIFSRKNKSRCLFSI